MAVIKTRCWVQKPNGGYYKDCLAIFDIEFLSWVWLILISAIIGVISYFIYSKIRKIEFEIKNFLLKSLFVSAVILTILILLIKFGPQPIY